VGRPAESWLVVDSIGVPSSVTVMTVEHVRLPVESLANFGMSLFIYPPIHGPDSVRSFPAIHPCTQPCHAPASCSEAEPCMAAITLTCPCGRIRQSSPCGRSTSSPAGREGNTQIKCTSECALAKRNARLAEALGIAPDRRGAATAYADDLVAYARANAKFCGLVEKTFADFIASDKRTQVLPHMPVERRKFVHDVRFFTSR
jgi:hypothetical protein